jgi:hypothetical protein
VSNSTCGWCSRELPGTGGTCSSRAAPLTCVDPYGTFLTSAAQCAAPGDKCENYAGSCETCAVAPASLNCGYCSSATTKGCFSGNAAGPLSPAGTCGKQNSGWGFLSAACTVQAVCNQHSKTNCTACQAAGSQCGYCSSTERCEAGNGLAPQDADCTAPGQAPWVRPATERG